MRTLGPLPAAPLVRRGCPRPLAVLIAIGALGVVALAPARTVPPAAAAPDEGALHLACFGAGSGPSVDGDVVRLLDDAGTFGQSNAIAFDRAAEGAAASWRITGRVRVDEGGDGGAFLLLDTDRWGVRGPPPFLPLWTQPDLERCLAVGLDVHDPPNSEPFGPWGNYQAMPEREVSLHWDGRELVKRVAAQEFRGAETELDVLVEHVVGGAEITVRLGEDVVYDRWFVAGMHPYEARLAAGAGTRDDVATRFDVAGLALERGPDAGPVRPPVRVEVFHHVLTDNSTTSYDAEVDLPPASWAFGRVLLTLEIHDAGSSWDEWDRNGHLYVVDEDGSKWDIVPFITSYRTPCRWVVDVTPFRPLLAGSTRFEIHAGTTFYKDRGYAMSVSLDFHHGTPEVDGRPHEPFAVVPLWHLTARHGAPENHFRDAYRPVEVAIPPETIAARVRTTTTGHSQVGEFTPSVRAIVVDPDVGADGEPLRFEDTLWKTDCWLNPNRPQFGTWKYSRAGWAPGDVVRPWWIDLSSRIVPGAKARFLYEPQPYDFSDVPEERRPSDGDVAQASHVVRSFLLLSREPDALVPAPVLRVTNVSGGSAAAEAGLLAGDWLATYDGARVDSVADLGAAKQAATDAGKERVVVGLFRGDERLEVEMASGQMGVNLSGP